MQHRIRQIQIGGGSHRKRLEAPLGPLARGVQWLVGGVAIAGAAVAGVLMSGLVLALAGAAAVVGLAGAFWLRWKMRRLMREAAVPMNEAGPEGPQVLFGRSPDGRMQFYVHRRGFAAGPARPGEEAVEVEVLDREDA
jgi:hypothetical protein